ncbi:MAG: phosphate ABC transporter permease subunit PstC, partial [Microcoleus sp. SIO2G3]|nr:phosphate ABC transporter permease subunit PstC [Microcoleus sp. SIO2G3]
MTDFSKQADNLTHSPLAAEFDTDLTSTKGQGVWLEYGFTGLVWLMAITTAGVLFWLSWIIFKEARPAVEEFGLGFLWSQMWNVGQEKFGALPFIYGTLV